jgi:MFS family permease
VSKRLILPTLLVGAFMPTLDFFIVNVAIPSINRSVHPSSGELELVAAIYAVVYASLLVLGGRIGDRIGHKRGFIAGMVLFTASSVLCGVTWNAWSLIVARALQGGAAAVMFPQVLAVIQIIYDGRARVRAIMWYAVALGTAAVAGQLVGGALLSLNLFGWSWRWVFLVNLPVGIVTVPAALRLLPSTGTERRPAFDRAGAALCGIGLLLLVLPLTVGRSDHWPVWSVAAIVCAPIVLGAFWLWERRLERGGGAPLLPPSLLSARTMRVGLTVVIAFYSSLASFLFVLAVQLQLGQGMSPIVSGLVSCPLAIGFLAASLVGRPVTLRWGIRPLVVAMAIQALGYLGQYWVIAADPASVNLPILIVLLGVNGVCTGTVMAPLLGLVLTGVQADRTGAASGLLATTQQVAGAIGLSLIGILFYAAPAVGAISTSHAYQRSLWFLIAVALATMVGLAVLGRAARPARPARPAPPARLARPARPAQQRADPGPPRPEPKAEQAIPPFTQSSRPTVLREKSLGRDALLTLVRGEAIAIVVADYYPAGTCAEFAQWVIDDSWYGEYENVPGVHKWGLNTYEGLSSKERERSYYENAPRAIMAMRERWLPYLSPVDRLRLELQEAWPAGANLEHLDGHALFVGQARVFEGGDGAVPHQDFLPWELADLRRAPRTDTRAELIGQLTANLYLQTPKTGGELELWSAGLPHDVYDGLRDPVHTYGLDRARLDPPAATIKPADGMLVLFHSTRPHAVRPAADCDRIALSFFIGVRGLEHPLTYWS